MIATESESGETGSRQVASCQKLGLMILAHRLAARPDAFTDQAIQIRSGSVLHNHFMIHAFGRTEMNWMQEVGSGIYNPA